jgi:hypothetical protein
MIICNSRRFIFVHVMKCAGTAIDAALAPHMRWNDLRFGQGPAAEAMARLYAARFGLHKHVAAHVVRDVVGPEVWEAYLTMATVRRPYERVASAWGFTAATLEPYLEEAGFPADAEEATRLAWLASESCPRAWQWHWSLGRAYLRLRGRPDAFSRWLRDPEVQEADTLLRDQHRMLADPADGRVLVKQVIRVEELDRRWPDFAAAIGLPGLALPRENATDPRWRPSAEALFRDPADVALVNRLHAADFAAFGYGTWPA